MASHNDILGAKLKAPVAVFPGNVLNVKLDFKPLRRGSVDSSVQMRENQWAPAQQAILSPAQNLPVTKPCLWGGDSYQPVDGMRSSLGGEQKMSHSIEETKLLSLLPSHWEKEEGNAAAETFYLKNKILRRMSEGAILHTGLVGLNNSNRVLLKPTLSKSASQKLLNTPRLVPPIKRSESPHTNAKRGNKEDEEALGISAEDLEVTTAEAADTANSVSEEVLDSLRVLRYSAEKKRKSFSNLIPPIPNSTHSAEMDFSLPYSITQQTNGHVTEDASKTWSSLESELNVKNLKQLENGSHEMAVSSQRTKKVSEETIAGIHNGRLSPPSKKMTPAGMEINQDALKQNLEGEDLKNSGRIQVAISKSAQEKMRRKQKDEFQQLHREKIVEWSQQLNGQPPSTENTTATYEEFQLFHPTGTSGAAVSTEQLHGVNSGIVLKKRVNKSSLPSIPTVPQVNNSQQSTALSLSRLHLDSADWKNEEDVEMKPFSWPEHTVIDVLKALSNQDWEIKKKGLFGVQRLASCHPEVLLTRIHDVTLAVTQEVNNLRSKVSRYAIRTLSKLFDTLKKSMDQEVDEIARVLLHKTGDSNEFIRDEADQALTVMVDNVTPARTLTALITGGASHRNTSVRKCMAEHLTGLVEQMGAEKLLSGTKSNTDLLIQTAVKLVQDGNQNTRYYGRKMLTVLSSHSDFEKCMKRSLQSPDHRYIMTVIKQKGVGNSPVVPPSSRSQSSSRSNSSATSQDKQPSIHIKEDSSFPSEPQEQQHQQQQQQQKQQQLQQQLPAIRKPAIRCAEMTEQLKELTKLLTAKEFQERMQGISLLLEGCQSSLRFVISNIVMIFDSFSPRLQDSNKKVNQFALESMSAMIPLLKDSLHPVLLSVVTSVTDNLNSKNSGIYTAAVTVLDTLIMNIDNALLLQPFAGRVQFISGRAMHDITERLSVLVVSVYPRRPQAVERHVLPVLWYFLSKMTRSGVLPGGSGNIRAVVSKLAKSLHSQMGQSLQEYVSSQPPHVSRTLQDLINTVL